MGRFVILIVSCFFLHFCSARDIITVSTPVRDNESLLSNSTIFRFGFFKLGNSSDRFVGIWYNNIPVQTIVWVANKEAPIKDSSGIISISEDGNLVVKTGRDQILWSTNVSVPLPARNKTWVQLMDSGNLMLQDSTNNGETIWESFKHPYDTFLPRMTLGSFARTGENRRLTSWKSPSDPSIGSFTAGLNPLIFPELLIWKNNITQYRSGPWNGQVFVGLPDMDSLLFLDGFNLNNDNQGTASMSYANDSFMYHFTLDSEGIIFQKDWDKGRQGWRVGLKLPATTCDAYGKCGPFGTCNSKKTPICDCLKGFVPKNQEAWNRGNWSEGCVRRVPLRCERAINGSGAGKQDRFLKLQKMKVPDFFQRSEANEQVCPGVCLSTCSCTAYVYDRGIGCLLWNRSLIDTQAFLGSGIDLYIRLANSEIAKATDRRISIGVPVASGTIVISICLVLTWCLVAKRRAMKKKRDTKLLLARMDNAVSTNLSKAKLKDLPLFEFEALAAATDNFGFRNKLGQGGFGPVYKGKLRDGQEIAVKRLSQGSGQGLEELINEVVVISKLQHRNLVKLLGCCIDGQERMLVYEFMPKKSLDFYLFDPLKQELLNWKARFNIVDGICRGLLYLHRDSRLKIIHRDLKASNILLDEHLNPKISDFGMARIFRGNEDEANTKRVVGTYGYMSPEYAMGGLFSEKSDVFSLGVIILEIISGKRNSSHHKEEQSMSLLSYAWRLWSEDKAAALADPVISDQSFEKEIRRCVQIGLLCVQEYPNDRPSVSTVIWMLNTENAELPVPKQPALIPRRGSTEAESSTSSSKASANNVSVTTIVGR